MSNITVSLNTLLEKTKHYDKDERWMATSDLCTFMQRSPGLDSATEGRICNAILNLLNDDSADVQAIAVRTLTTLYSICTPQLRTIASTLLGRLMSEEKGLRDVYANGLKKLLADNFGSACPRSAATASNAGGQRGIDPLLRGAVVKKSSNNNNSSSSKHDHVAVYSLEVLSELMLHFGNCEMVMAQGERIVGILLGVLKDGQPDLVKRAIPCLGRTTAHLSVQLVERTVETLAAEIRQGGSNSPIYVRTLSSLTQHCGRSLRSKSGLILEILLEFVKPNDGDSNMDGDDDDDDDEDQLDEEQLSIQTQLRESTFTAISSLMESTPSIVMGNDNNNSRANLIKITDCISYFLKYDPNYFESDDEDDEDDDDNDNEMSDDNDDEDDDDLEDDEDDLDAYGVEDDDDESWKIRRAALRCATSLIQLCNTTSTKSSSSSSSNATSSATDSAAAQALGEFLWIGNTNNDTTTTTATTTNKKKYKSLSSAILARIQNNAERESHVLLDALAAFQLLLQNTDGDNTNSNSATSEYIASKRGVILTTSTALLKAKAHVHGKSSVDVKVAVLAILQSLGTTTTDSTTTTEEQAALSQVMHLLEHDNKSLKHAALVYLHSLQLDQHALAAPYLLQNQQYLQKIVNLTQSTEEWYKIHALALDVLAQLCHNTQAIIHTSSEQQNQIAQTYYTALTPAFQQADLDTSIKTSTLLCTAALLTSSLLVNNQDKTTTTLSSNQVEQCVQYCCSKCQEVSVRSTALRALLSICTSEYLNFAPYFVSTLGVLADLLSKEQKLSVEYIRTFKQGVLDVLLAMLQNSNNTSGIDDNDDQIMSVMDRLLAQLGEIIAPNDLHISHFGLCVTLAAMNAMKNHAKYNIVMCKLVCRHVVSSLLALVSAPLKLITTQEAGSSTNSNASNANPGSSSSNLLTVVTQILCQLVFCSTTHAGSDAAEGCMSFQELYTSIHSRARECTTSSTTNSNSTASTKSTTSISSSKRTLHNLAVCIASITAVSTPAQLQQVQSELLSVLESPQGGDLQLMLALLTVGELGQRVDLSKSCSAFHIGLLTRYMYGNAAGSSAASAQQYEEEIRSCAAYALGHVCVGCMDTFLPLLLEAFEAAKATGSDGSDAAHAKTQYLLLSSVKEIIVYHLKSHCKDDNNGGNGSVALPHTLLQDIEPHLTAHLNQKEEGVRTMVAECFGALAALHPDAILAKLSELAARYGSSHDVRACWTVLNSVRCAIVNHVDGGVLGKYLPSFLALLDEQDLEVRTAGLLMVNSVVHYQPNTVTTEHDGSSIMSSQILPKLYELSKLTVRREVNLGPFKEIVDDALPTRRAALSVFTTSLKNCPQVIDIPAFMPILAASLGDVQDAQLQAHQIVISVSAQHPQALLDAVDTFVEPLEKTCRKKKGTKTGAELERLLEWIKSALRTMLVLSRLEGLDSEVHRKFCDFVDRIKKNPAYANMLAQLEEENISAPASRG
eukprot:CAMPEP_0116049680 /NCGR_PEP_ID=MMETSP0321-20121206/30299_1 /TAXON_ID=163516 /ORGANISM="Leptocylindrus danicus var. danicus, Strain B650" /LENGTH=1467 /DNA_ID=CAMNT_0003532133 /DNA_START=31 /DNA_END=4435 /DNA_ORIENTATION=+